MLEGIHILNQKTLWTADGFDLTLGIMSLLLLLVCILVISGSIHLKQYDGVLVFMFFSIICAVLSLGSLSSYFNRTSYELYHVVIDKNVPFKEFTDKYEIINKDGNLYTIKEKKAKK